MYKYITMNPRPEHVAEWFPNDRKWSIDELNIKKSIKLKVFFMNECPMTWKYNEKEILNDVVMNFLEESWKNCFGIVRRMDRNPHIRVQYQGNLTTLFTL